MTPPLRATAIAGLAGLGLLVLFGMAGRVSPEPALITSDTRGYCLELLERVRALMERDASAPRQLTRLIADGGRHCELGDLRGGIFRLRRAMVMLRPVTAGE